MKTTFAALAIGQKFDLGIDADGYEPYYYKLSATEAYQISGGPHGGRGRETFEPDAVVFTDGEIVAIHAQPTEVERAAFTVMLNENGKPLSDHPALNLWVIAMATDADEVRDLDTYIYETADLRAFCQENGWIAPSDRYDSKRSTFLAILNHKPRGARPETAEQERWRSYEDATLRLADAIRTYRYAGRPDGDQEHTIMGMGAPMARVSTSLAAAIGEYHRQLLNIYAGEQMELAAALHDALPTDLITQTEAAKIANVTPQAINNAIATRRLRAYSKPDALAHRPGDRLVSRADVEKHWPPRVD